MALSLFGIFVLFFSVFAIAYIYLKCFRTAIAKSSKNIEGQVQYRSLSLDTRQPVRSAYEEPREQLMADSTYLSPVVSHIEGNEISSFQINNTKIYNDDVSRETTGDGHSLSHVPTYTENETNISLKLEERAYHHRNCRKHPGKCKCQLLIIVNHMCLATLRKTLLRAEIHERQM